MQMQSAALPEMPNPTPHTAQVKTSEAACSTAQLPRMVGCRPRGHGRLLNTRISPVLKVSIFGKWAVTSWVWHHLLCQRAVNHMISVTATDSEHLNVGVAKVTVWYLGSSGELVWGPKDSETGSYLTRNTHTWACGIPATLRLAGPSLLTCLAHDPVLHRLAMPQ